MRRRRRKLVSKIFKECFIEKKKKKRIFKDRVEMEGESSKTKRAVFNDRGFLDVVLSWSLEDIYNENLYKNQV
jgi:hypothetical protein